MDLLAQYSDDDVEATAQEVGEAAAPKPAVSGALAKAKARKPVVGVDEAVLPLVCCAPDVELIGLDVSRNYAITPLNKRMMTNPSWASLNKPIQGPQEVGKGRIETKFNNHHIGHVEKAHMSKFSFDEQYQTFHNFGFAANPSRNFTEDQSVLKSTEANAQWGRSIFEKSKRRKINSTGDAVDEDDVPLEKIDGNKWGGFADESTVRKEIENEVKLREEEAARQKEEEKAVEGEERETKERITSIFHGAKDVDYAGRSWIENKATIAKDIDDKKCFLPKKWIHTWSGHTMGVQQIRWFPKTAHLILSAGMDAKIKIWDYHNQRKCLRTYMGHDQAVRDVNFTDDGRRFYSVSYDKNIQYWDTETGQIIGTYTNKKTPFCVAVHPNPSMQNIIVTGCSNKKAVQWDMNTGTIVQEYDEHLGAVNTVTFCEEGKRILTTSDDKKIFMWEYGIPVVVKHIAEPTMHSVPSVVVSPDKKYLIGQSMDNKIITYEAYGRFKFMGKKQFKGHLNSGYAITPGWSADGHWIMSGDADGKLWFWDWQKMKNYRVLKAHDGVCSSCMWHPSQPSRVVTCGWDGAIKLWD